MSGKFLFVILVVLSATSTALTNEPWTTLVDGNMERIFLSVWTVAAILLALAIPRLRASFFLPSRRVPSDTYAFPRWIVHLCIAVSFGQATGVLVLALTRDYRLLWLAASLTLVGMAFVAGAWGRLRKHPCTEFVVPWFPFRLR